ncbi:MAG: cation:proton antiporter [Candidatus Binatia bacterium]
MDGHQQVFIAVAGFVVVVLASRQIGQYFTRAKLPRITGYLLAGILVGPFGLDVISTGAIAHLRFIDELALSLIAFAAGSELVLKELRSRFKSITWVTTGLVVSTFTLGSAAMFLLAGQIPFLQDMLPGSRIAVSILAGTILVARSPSSAVAVVKELRAKGPFTHTALGVTVIMDAVVIILFAINSEIAHGLLTRLNFNGGFVLLLAVELLISLACSYGLGRLIQLILSLRIHGTAKAGMTLLSGYGVFVLSVFLRTASYEALAFELVLEPLLICMIAGFMVANYGGYRDEFSQILEELTPLTFVAFFTLAGASLALDILIATWPIAIALFSVRLGSIFLGSFTGGMVAGDPMKQNRISWLAYVTQAGVGLGLAEEVAVEFPQWGATFATMMIAVIVLNQIVGPVLFKWAINRVGEGHTRAGTPAFDGVRDALIFGLEGQSVALARQLRAHGWKVKVVATDGASSEGSATLDVEFCTIRRLNLESLRQLDAEHADAIVAMLSDDENYQIAELAYEHFGIKTFVVRLNDRANFDRFHELGALIVDPSTAIISLLDQFVRSPLGTSLLLGMEGDQDIIDLEVLDPNLHGAVLRDLRLPLDTLIVSVHRGEQLLNSHGYTRLELGDRVTIIGSAKSLDVVKLFFGE